MIEGHKLWITNGSEAELFIVFATVIEYNIIKDTFAGADPLGRLQELSARDFRNAGSAGIVAAFLGMAVLS